MKELEKQIKKKEKKEMNNLRKERDVLILVLLVFNIIELIGAIIVKGDWGIHGLCQCCFLTSSYY